MAKIEVDTTFDADAATDPVKVTMAGVECTVVDDPPIGAMIVFTRRISSKNAQEQLGGVLELCDKWIVDEDRDDLYEAVSNLHAGEELDKFLQTDMAALVQAVAARPT